MTGYFIELLNLFSAFAAGFPILLYPMREARDVKKGFISAYIIGFAVLTCAALFIARRFIVMDINSIQTFRLCFIPLQIILPVAAFRKRLWQVVFLIAVTSLYYPIFTGLGNYAAVRYFPENPMLCASLVSLGVIAVTLPPLLIMLRRIYTNSGFERADAFWRFAWLIPVSFHAFIVPQGTFVTGDDFGVWFIIIRFAAYAVMLLICYIFDIVTKQIAEAEKVKQEAEKLAERTAFYHRMAHDLLTPLTKVSTNVQIARELKPDDLDELLQKSQDEIMKMSGMINKALGGGEGR